MEGSLAQKSCGLGQLESQLFSALQATQAALEEDRKGLAERERQLALMRREQRRREEQRLQAEKDLFAQREALEARERGLAQVISKFDEHVAAQKLSYERFERRFAKKTKAAEKALVEHEKQLRRSLLQKFRAQVRKREDRIKAKYVADAQQLAELEKVNSKLERRLKRAKAGRRLAEEARDEAVHGPDSLAKGMEEQVAPAMERVAETPVSAQAASVLAKQCEHLFEALVTRGNELAAQLGADAPHTGDRGHDDAATHLATESRP